MLVMGASTPPPWMLNDHFRELTAYLGMEHVLVRPEPNWEFYLDEQRAGRLVYVVARDFASSQPIVGYMAMLLQNHPHYRSVIMASDDLHYLMPFWRGSGWGGKMLEIAEGCAAEAGAKLFRVRSRFNVTQSEHDHLLRKRGYTPCDVVYVKDLTHDQKPLPD